MKNSIDSIHLAFVDLSKPAITDSKWRLFSHTMFYYGQISLRGGPLYVHNFGQKAAVFKAFGDNHTISAQISGDIRSCTVLS